ncbi:CKLF-like MARVEL transmembrane domain-containing protein 2B [Apodemus speciosus]|uniref:CKLF-like MARVEL transmembrane domain-containing protein 2B n=1 Tax=Apodemus speciosus TaxID=105296 RepID=A0ABQ0F2V1_APOSI
MTAASVFCLTIGGAQELFVVIMIQETCIVLFFIIIYLVTLQDTLACIHWPLLDMINTLISTVFIGIIGIIVIGEENTKDLCYTGASIVGCGEDEAQSEKFPAEGNQALCHPTEAEAALKSRSPLKQHLAETRHHVHSICIVAALICFQRVATHPFLILILTMELSICAFFFFIYSFAINRYIPFIFWPTMDLMNDLFCSIFLLGGVAFAVEARREFPMPYLSAMILMGLAAFFTIIDLCLQRRQYKTRKLRKYFLLAPDKNGKMQDPKLLMMLAAKEDEEEKQKELAEKAKREAEAW